MAINSVSNNPYTSSLALQFNFKQAKADFKTLASALQSGYMSGARQALTTLQKELPQLGAQSSASQPSPFSDLVSAVQSGDLAGAQKALATLQQAKGRHGHYHHAQATSTQPPIPDLSASTVSPGNTDDGTSPSLLNATA